VRIILNGKADEVDEGASVLELIEKLGLSGRRLAVLMDNEVVRKSQFGDVRLRADCKIEIVQMVGGG